MPGLIHATAAANWSLGGSILTFAFPMLLFIVAATVLYLLFSRPHRIPGHSDLVPAQTAPPDRGTAHTTAAAAQDRPSGATDDAPSAPHPDGDNPAPGAS